MDTELAKQVTDLVDDQIYQWRQLDRISVKSTAILVLGGLAIALLIVLMESLKRRRHVVVMGPCMECESRQAAEKKGG